MKIILKIITPEKTVFEQDTYQVTLPVEGGEVTILPGHEPYIGAVKAGEIMIRREPSAPEESFATSGGFVEFHENSMMFLADTAERADEIDIERAEAARKRAEDLKLERIQMDDEEYARTAAALEKELARVKVARKHHNRRGLSLGAE
jgi:F-type H+-transporting ATPase subunit epsilon